MIPKIVCPKCEFRQAPTPQCRRCAATFEYPAEIGVSVNDRPLPTMMQAERELILATVSRLGGNTVAAAHALGIGKTTLYRKLKEYQNGAI
jgi:sigma-54 dependent transcriptional regulator, acetoin dehydrogenase operon transcriptional activator AcoR